MSLQDEKGIIKWRMHFSSPPEKVYEALATQEGREKYWAESSPEKEGVVEFHILKFPPFSGEIIEQKPSELFVIEYFGTLTRFELKSDGKGGTDLFLVATGIDDEAERLDMIPGWVSVLMAMKAAVDFGVDLRNHDIERTWQDGYADN